MNNNEQILALLRETFTKHSIMAQPPDEELWEEDAETQYDNDTQDVIR